jgi:hypothetical protein
MHQRRRQVLCLKYIYSNIRNYLVTVLKIMKLTTGSEAERDRNGSGAEADRKPILVGAESEWKRIGIGVELDRICLNVWIARNGKTWSD